MAYGTSWTPGCGGDVVPSLLLRVRNLKTNFYTYAGNVQALEGVSFDLWEGETLGLVGETGCGKSVTALSVLRLIPQPPGRIEEGEALFDVPAETAVEIDALEAQVNQALPGLLGRPAPADLSVRRLRVLRSSLKDRAAAGPVVRLMDRLAALKRPFDLFEKTEPELQAIRGNRIAMIFQEPMQALNPLFPIGDQIAENILLHQRDAVALSLVAKMDLESERDALARDLRTAAPGRSRRRQAPATSRGPRDSSVFTLLAVSLASVVTNLLLLNSTG